MRFDVPLLGQKAVHVWSCDLATPMATDEVQDAARILCDFERERLARLVFERDRVRYRRAHLWLRHVLGAYLGVDAAAVPLQQGGQRKPEIAGSSDLSFNLAHSADVALLAVSRLPHVGVDVEVPGEHRNLESTARGVYTAAEQQELSQVEASQFERAFLTLWTRKEAVLKSMGVGLMLNPTRLHVGLKNGDHAGAIRVAVPPGDYGDTIDVADLSAGGDWISAIAVPQGWDSLAVFPADANRKSS